MGLLQNLVDNCVVKVSVSSVFAPHFAIIGPLISC